MGDSLASSAISWGEECSSRWLLSPFFCWFLLGVVIPVKKINGAKFWGYTYLEGASQVALVVKNHCQCRRDGRCGFDTGVGKIPWRRARQPIPVFLPGKSHGQEPGGLWSMGLQRVGHNWSNSACIHTCRFDCVGYWLWSFPSSYSCADEKKRLLKIFFLGLP